MSIGLSHMEDTCDLESSGPQNQIPVHAVCLIKGNLFQKFVKDKIKLGTEIGLMKYFICLVVFIMGEI